jgi:hypothetical protein
MTAKKKDGRAIQNSDYERKFIGQLSSQRMRPLNVFVGGGGSRSAWYCSTISSTYKEFRHDSAGLPPYKMVNMPSPKDFTAREADEGDYTPFAISYGLCRLVKVPKKGFPVNSKTRNRAISVRTSPASRRAMTSRR